MPYVPAGYFSVIHHLKGFRMIKRFRKRNQLYPNLNPTERIPAVIREYVFPELEHIGFRIMKSGLSIKNEENQFRQEIWFSKSKWNIGNEICSFTPHFAVPISSYNKWHEKQYGEKPLNDVLEAHAANYIDGWQDDLFDGNDYDLAKDDNHRIVELLLENITKSGLRFLAARSNHSTAVDFLVKKEHYFIAPKMIDICLMHEDIKLANEVLTWFRNYERRGKSDFMESTLSDMNHRENLLRGEKHQH